MGITVVAGEEVGQSGESRLGQLILPDENELFDDSDDQYAKDSVRLNPNLSEAEIEDALRMNMWAKSGTIVVSGELGSGKTLFVTTSIFKLHRYFPERSVILDYPPRRLFGHYLPFSAIMESYNDYTKLAIKQHRKLDNKFMSWMERYGRHFLKGSILGLDEFWNYAKITRLTSNITDFIRGLVKLTRRLDMTIFGMTPSRDEIDPYGVLKYCTAEARCVQTMKQGVLQINLYPTKFVDGTGAWSIAGKTRRITLDGTSPIPELGGKCYFDLYPSKIKEK